MKLTPFHLLITVLISLATTNVLIGQDDELVIKRATIDNFLTDPVANNSADSKTLDSVFVMTLPSTGQKVYWSSLSCRLIAVKNGQATTGLTELEANGPHPLALSLGATGSPKFFGVRIVNGIPEYLYTFGQLSIEETFRFSADGKRLYQNFKIQSNAIQGNFTVPEKWRETLTGDNGRWSKNVLKLTKLEMQEGFTFTFHLDPNASRE